MNPTAEPQAQPTTQDHATSPPRARGRFVTEGQFLALPLVVPGECEPIPDDAASIERIAASSCGRWVHGVTTGRDRHLFTALFKAAAGGVVNLGTLDDDAELAAIAHWTIPDPQRNRDRPAVLLGLNHADRFELLRQSVPSVDDAIQEPGYGSARQRSVARRPDQRLLDARPVDRTSTIACLTANGPLLIEGLTGEPIGRPEPVPTTIDTARFAAVGPRLAWLADRKRIACIDPSDGSAHVQSLTTALPDEPLVAWVGIDAQQVLAVLRGGAVWRLNVDTGDAVELARTPLGPVQCAALLPDQRVYAMCGDDVAQFCRIDPGAGHAEPLGAVASAIVSKRYGFNFADAAVTPDGVAFFAEHDRGGCLWAYYPPLAPGTP